MAVALVLAALAATRAAAEPVVAPKSGNAPTLQQALAGLVGQANLGEQVGVSIVDLASGREVASHHASLPLNPASNMKLVTAATALVELGPDFQMLTGLYGRIEGDTVVGGLTLKGHGDPSLEQGDLLALARELYARGVRKVDEVMVDGGYFDDQILPPAFDQQPEEFAAFRAAVGAVSVDANAYTIWIRPGTAVGKSALVYVDGSGYFDLTNQVTTSASGVPNVIAVQSPKSGRLALRLSGSVPLGVRGLSYRRRVESPVHYAGYLLVDALRAARIQVPERVTLRPVPASVPMLAVRGSPPLANILYALGKHSDNFTAEMLLKVLGAERAGKPGSSARGAQVAIEALKRLGVPTSNVRIVNGSGLFEGNAIAAGHLTQLLRSVHANAAVRSEFLAHLAIGGVDGTLAERLQDLPARSIVRAKTGTLASVAALSGYVLGPEPASGMAFSVIVNGAHGRVHAARSLADAVVSEIAKRLYAPARR